MAKEMTLKLPDLTEYRLQGSSFISKLREIISRMLYSKKQLTNSSKLFKIYK
jgi:hypothetical protein